MAAAAAVADLTYARWTPQPAKFSLKLAPRRTAGCDLHGRRRQATSTHEEWTLFTAFTSRTTATAITPINPAGRRPGLRTNERSVGNDSNDSFGLRPACIAISNANAGRLSGQAPALAARFGARNCYVKSKCMLHSCIANRYEVNEVSFHRRDQSSSLNSTKNCGRRCLTPLSPHRNYIRS